MKSKDKITLGQNLKRIRKELGLRQHEIIGEELTRNAISMIENSKSPMNYRVAQIVAENMNKVCRERSLEVYIDPEDLMNPTRIKAKRKANKYVNFLKNNLNEKLHILEPVIEEITAFLNQWKIPDKKVEIYELLGEISRLNSEFDWEYLYLNKALENYFLVPIKRNIHVICKKLIVNCIYSERYKESLTLMKLDIMNKDHIPKEFKATIYYNKALVYKRLGEYDRSLDIINEYEGYFGENNMTALRYGLVVKATCHSKKNEKNKAIKVYKKLIDNFEKDIEEVGLAYSNIISLLMELNLKEEVIKYRDKLNNILSSLERSNNKYLTNIYEVFGELNEYLGKLDLAEFYYISAVDKALDRNEDDKGAEILFKLLNLYSKTNQSEKILLSNNIFKRGFESTELNNRMKLVLSLILTNMEIGEEEIASNIIKDILKEGNKNED